MPRRRQQHNAPPQAAAMSHTLMGEELNGVQLTHRRQQRIQLGKKLDGAGQRRRSCQQDGSLGLLQQGHRLLAALRLQAQRDGGR